MRNLFLSHCRNAWASTLAAFTLAAVMGMAAPRMATAGEYTIHACQADKAGYASSAFEDFATRGMLWRRACNPLGPPPRGLVTANVMRSGRVERGAQSSFVLNAPPGASFARLRWSGHAQRRDCRYALQVFAERPEAQPVSIKNVRANRNCPRPDLAQASSWPRPRSYELGNAARIVQRVVCVGTPSRPFCSARGRNTIRTFAAEATVIDWTAPATAVVTDVALTRGEWVGGRQSFAYEASDNVGIRSAFARLGDRPEGNDSKVCSYWQRIPCPNGRGELYVDTRQVAEGSQSLSVVATDAAGNVAESQPITVRIDNSAPEAVPIGLLGGETWRSNNDFDIAWANPAEPDRAPITAAHYRLCRVATSECLSGERAGTGVAQIPDLAVPAPGEWELRVWRRDAVGNQQPSSASLPVRLRFDPEPPHLGFEAPSVADPTRVAVVATDQVSGVGAGAIEISAAGSGTWQELATSKEGDRLVARIEDAALPAGDYGLRASARDLAGNLAGTDRRLDGQPMRLRLPLRIPTTMSAGIVAERKVTRTVKRGAKKRKVRRTVTGLERRATVPYGRQVRLAGQIVNRAGHALAGARIDIHAQVDEGSEQLAGSATTDADGRFAYEVQAHASTTFRFAYPGTTTTLPVEGAAGLLVRADSSFTVTPKHVLNGDSVTFRGRVMGRPLPEAGKLLELQWRVGKAYQTFRTIRTDPAGRWRIPYPFDRTCGIQVYRFRVHLPGEANYPLEPGSSQTLPVRVKGQPCY